MSCTVTISTWDPKPKSRLKEVFNSQIAGHHGATYSASSLPVPELSNEPLEINLVNDHAII